MAIGKRLITQCCVASALLIFCVAAAASLYLVSSGKQLCVPSLSIRCHESDCGSFFQRCGSNELVEVPEQKACYKGALLPASRSDLHSCPSRVTIPRNSSQLQYRSSDLMACDCSLCSYPQSCECQCTQGGGNVNSAVTCQSKRYPSLAVAMSVGVPAKLCSEAPMRPMWEVALESVQRHYSKIFLEQWSVQDLAASFTFQPPLITDGLEGTCSCYISPACVHSCGG